MRMEALRRTTTIETTQQDKGVKLTIVVVAYDNGLLNIDGVVMNGTTTGVQWPACIAVMAEKVLLLQEYADKRQRKLAG